MRKFISLAFAAFAISFLFVSSASAQSTVSVTESTSEFENDPGWFFQRDAGNQTAAQFTNQKSSLGNGSLFGGVIGSNPAEKFIAERFSVIPMADVNSISFDFLVGGNGTAASANQFYMSVYALFAAAPDTKFYDCRYSVVATSASTTSFKTVTFDPTQAYPVTTSGSSTGGACPAIPANMGAGAKIRVYAINIGDTGSGDVGLGGYLDNVVENLVSGKTIFDFNMSSKECKQGGWMTKIGSDGNPYSGQGPCMKDTEARRVN